MRANRQLDTLLYRAAVWLLPTLIILFSAISLLGWETHYPAAHASRLTLRAWKDISGSAAPEEARRALESRPPVHLQETALSELPFWLLVTIPPTGPEPQAIEFPSRHVRRMACWDGETLQPLGSGDRGNPQGKLQPVKGGFSLPLAPSAQSHEILCRTEALGPARLTALRWPVNELEASDNEFHRNAGLLDGGLIVLALFMAMMALMLRNGTYTLFSVWLVVNLRVGALSAGWDTQWLGHTVPDVVQPTLRAVSMALCYLLTIALVRHLFRDELRRVRLTWLVQAFLWTSLPLLALSVTLPYGRFLPAMWIFTGVAIVGLVLVLLRVLLATRSRVAMWYSTSFGVLLVANLYEIISAALGINALLGAVNSVTGALASSILAAFAVAEHMRQENSQRREAQAELAHSFEATPIGLFTLDLQGRFLSANPAMQHMLGANLLSSPHNVWDRHFEGHAWMRLYDAICARAEAELELVGRKGSAAGEADGDRKRFLVKAALSQGKIEGWLQDVTAKSRALEELQFLANHDPLTKIINRRGIEEAFERVMRERDPDPDKRAPVALAYLDLDRFKLINDLYGHHTGDEILRGVCQRIRALLTGAQRFGRVGGDEFVIIMPDATIPSASWTCKGVADRIQNEPFRVDDKAFQLGVSIGLIEVDPGMSIKDALSLADRACRQAKSQPGDHIVVYERNAQAVSDRASELDLVAQLSAGQLPDGLYLEMQPIMSLTRPAESLNFEVLLRRRAPDGSVTPAGRIISAAENSGRTGLIDRWVLSTTLAWIDANHDRLLRTRFVCMNLSGASLNDEKFVADVYSILAANARAAQRLCIEITESVALHDLNYTRRFIDCVRRFGVRVALDDFGAGYTSFSYLKELPADVLKIDGSFIVNMNIHPTNVAIVEAIVSLARNLGMKTIAEWAEDAATVKTLAECGIDYVQGFAVSRPQLPDRLLAANSAVDLIADADVAAFVRQLELEAREQPALRLIDFTDQHGGQH